jgi:hypothetical protein
MTPLGQEAIQRVKELSGTELPRLDALLGVYFLCRYKAEVAE